MGESPTPKMDGPDPCCDPWGVTMGGLPHRDRLACVEISDSDQTITPHDQLQESFEPAPLPPAAADGGPALEAAPLYLPIVTETLCDRGPCRHRHLFTCAMEAGEPMDGSAIERVKIGADGNPIVIGHHPDVKAWDGSVRAGAPIFATEPYVPKQLFRVCYAAPGVKIELSEDEPIYECSLWDPEDPDDPDTAARDRRRQRYATRHAPDVEDLNHEPFASSQTNGEKRKK
jgi:hypothetical protein